MRHTETNLGLREFAIAAALTALAAGPSCTAESGGSVPSTEAAAQTGDSKMNKRVAKTDRDWKESLTPEQYRVLREKGTERAFTGAYWNTKNPGTYHCAGCGQSLFRSQDKFDSGTGWPSFTRPIDEKNVNTEEDRSLFMTRTEVLCSGCGGHLGHVFEDGPEPTGLRYCINSVSLKLQEEK